MDPVHSDNNTKEKRHPELFQSQDNFTNIHAVARSYYYLFRIIRRKKLVQFGYVCSICMPSHRLVKSVFLVLWMLFGEEEDNQSDGLTFDNITEWTGLCIGDAVKKTDREQ